MKTTSEREATQCCTEPELIRSSERFIKWLHCFRAWTSLRVQFQTFTTWEIENWIQTLQLDLEIFPKARFNTDSYLNGRVKAKPAYNTGVLLQFRSTLRLMLADPLGELEPRLLFNFVGAYLFSNEVPGFIRPSAKRILQTLPPLRDKLSCNSQRINLAILFMVPVGLTWVHWEFSYPHFMVLVTSSAEQG